MLPLHYFIKFFPYVPANPSLPKQKADSTLRYSQAVPNPSTNQALSRLTSEVERDPVHSTRYGRQRRIKMSVDERVTQAVNASFTSAASCSIRPCQPKPTKAKS